MAFNGVPSRLSNWSKSAVSPCLVVPAASVADLARALESAQAQGLSVTPRGAGHSYTDAALNTNGVVIDVTPMRRILSWDAAQGIMRVEPGVTLQDVIRVAYHDGWWPYVTPSTPEVTVGGCAAMNVNGRNAWKFGPFGAHVLALEVILPSGEVCTLAPERDPQLFYGFVGSVGLLGIITSLTLQLQHISSGFVAIRRRRAASFEEIFAAFAEEERSSDLMEAWIDGFARGEQLGRGILTCAGLSDTAGPVYPSLPTPGRVETSLVSLAARWIRPALPWGVGLANDARHWLSRWSYGLGRRALFPYTFWPPAAFAGYHALLPQGAETFHAFVPALQAQEIFAQVLNYSQEQGCLPIWCIIKQHRRDPFLLSYQVDGFSLELNYPRTGQTGQALKPTLQRMIAIVIEAGGRFYLAKDHFLTHAQYRQSVGDEAVEAFLRLKRRYDPHMLLQSDLFRRIFLPYR